MVAIRVHVVEQSEADAVHKITEIVFPWFMVFFDATVQFLPFVGVFELYVKFYT